MPNMIPISSIMAAKMKSDSTNGILDGIPCMRPAPNRPPKLMAKSDCVI